MGASWFRWSLFAVAASANVAWGCDVVADTDQIVKTIRDAIANAKAHCPNPADEGDSAKNPASFSFTKTYLGGATVTRTCKVTTGDYSTTYTDGDGATQTAKFKYYYQIDETRPELGIWIDKDAAGDRLFRFAIFMNGDTANPVADCRGLLKDSETTTFTTSVIHCVPAGGSATTYRKDKHGASCF